MLGLPLDPEVGGVSVPPESERIADVAEERVALEDLGRRLCDGGVDDPPGCAADLLIGRLRQLQRKAAHAEAS